ncbi:MAG: hypothetical protein HFH93_05010 [Lachnospiraceae bacterium]|nr:hypothetical protein [Lachnospiraceae bacterium]
MSEKGTRMGRFVRRTAALGLAGSMLFGLSGEAFAATLKDVFDEHYYADSYEDLKEAFGYDREKLWNHFITFGVNEGRTMNELIDIVKYRAMYGDLDEAFGDDWNAYLEHYLTYGAKEGRDTGTEFNALDYGARYADLKEVFGDDVLALWKHYQEYGASENREARSQEVVDMEAQVRAWKAASAANPSKPEGEKPSDDATSGKGERSERIDQEDGSYQIADYNAKDQEIRRSYYSASGELTMWVILEYNTAGKWAKSTIYNGDGTMRSWADAEYDAAGNRVKSTNYDADGNVTSWDIREYDEAGKLTKVILTQLEYDRVITHIYKDGRIFKTTHQEGDGSWGESIRNESGKIIESNKYDSDGNRTSHTEYDSAGEHMIKYISYNADGTKKSENEYHSNGKIKKSITYNADGTKNTERDYDSDGNQIKVTSYNADGTVTITGYNSDGSISYQETRDAEGNIVG